MKGLIIKSPWIDMILDGKKPWEIRGRNTKIRGRIALIKSGTGMIYGTAEMVDSRKLSRVELVFSKAEHRINDLTIIPYDHIYAWVLQNPQRLEKPIPYRHPQGAVIWVNLNDDILKG